MTKIYSQKARDLGDVLCNTSHEKVTIVTDDGRRAEGLGKDHETAYVRALEKLQK